MYQTTRSRREILSRGLRCPPKQPLIGKLISCQCIKMRFKKKKKKKSNNLLKFKQQQQSIKKDELA